MVRAMKFIGIDPGITGGLVVIDGHGFLCSSARTPIIKHGSKREYDLPGMVALIQEHRTDATCAIEKVGAMPRDGKVGAFSFGKGYGLWLGMLTALGVPWQEVTPQRWQGRMLSGLPRGPHTKTSAVARSKSLFPNLPIRVKADWGMADAALIAAFLRQTY